MERIINSKWDFSQDNKHWTKVSLNTDYDSCKWRKLESSKWSCINEYGIYKRNDTFSEKELNAKYVYLFFTGVSETCELYVNNQLIYYKNNITTDDKWLEPFFVNIRPYITKNNNEIKIIVHSKDFKGILYAPIKYVFSEYEMILDDFYKSIGELNPNFYDLINQALRKKNPEMIDYLKGLRPFSLFWFSDVHGDELIAKRLLNFYYDNDSFFDDAINTGDMVDISFVSDFSYWNNIKGHENILLTIGNHENLETHINFDWSKHNPIDPKSEYKKFFAPYINNWNVSYEENKTFYYKDYVDKKIRLLVIDLCLFGEDFIEEYNWFKNSLKDALEKEYSIIVATHVMPITSEFIKIDCSYTNLDSIPNPDLYDKTKEDVIKLQKSIDDFINNGGDFIAWLGGHYHCDYIGYNKDFPKQLQIFIDSSNRGHSENFCDLSRVDGEKSMDLANGVIFDQEDKLIKIIRIGASIDRHLRDRSLTCINYKTKKVY